MQHMFLSLSFSLSLSLSLSTLSLVLQFGPPQKFCGQKVSLRNVSQKSKSREQ